MNYEIAVKNIRSELKNYVVDNNLKSLVLGVSGGIDSMLCALLAKPVCEELDIPLIGRSLPCSTNSDGEISRARITGDLFCTDFLEDNLQSIFENFKHINPQPDSDFEIIKNNMDFTKESVVKQTQWKIRNGNIKARLRMIYLYNLASSNNGIVLSTDNYTELLLGFWTLHGDVGDYGMIQNLWKTEVYEMSEWIMENELVYLKEKELVKSVIEADATDGLGITKSDLDQIMSGWEGSSRDGYKEVDKKLKDYLEGNAMFSTKDPVIQRHLRTEFKRKNPVNINRGLITNQ